MGKVMTVCVSSVLSTNSIHLGGTAAPNSPKKTSGCKELKPFIGANPSDYILTEERQVPRYFRQQSRNDQGLCRLISKVKGKSIL